MRDADGPAREEVPGTGGLLHRRVAAVVFSERGQGKSTVVLATCVAAAAAGEKVLYLDRENGAALTRERVEALLDAHEEWGDPVGDGQFVGRHYPEMASRWSPDAFAEAIAGLDFGVVAYDSLREFLARLDLDPDREKDISTFFGLAVTPLLRRGLAVALLDNTGHAETGRPKGSGTKLDAAQQAYQVATTSQFSAVEAGRISITCTRSRHGDLGRQWSMRVGGGLFEVPQATSEAPDHRRAREVKDAHETLRLAAVAALDERSPLGRDALLAAVRERGVKGKNATLRGWLADLAADSTSGVEGGEEGYRLNPGPPGPNERGQGGATPSAGPWPRPLSSVGGGRVAPGHPNGGATPSVGASPSSPPPTDTGRCDLHPLAARWRRCGDHGAWRCAGCDPSGLPLGAIALAPQTRPERSPA